MGSSAEYQRKFRKEHPEYKIKARLYRREYMNKHREEIAAYQSEYSAQYRLAHKKENYERSKRWKEKYPERYVLGAKKWREEHRKYLQEKTKLWRLNNPEKVKAHSALYVAKKKGKIISMPCIKCGSVKNINAHHTDYARPLKVTWLCIICHTALHRNLKKFGAAI